MKQEDKHSWDKLPDSDYEKVWSCKNCGCRKTLGKYKFATPSYERSGMNTQERPDCVDMSRRVEFSLD